jgi:hypothetical protein
MASPKRRKLKKKRKAAATAAAAAAVGPVVETPLPVEKPVVKKTSSDKTVSEPKSKKTSIFRRPKKED